MAVKMHGTYEGYRSGCHCEKCRAANAKRSRDRRAAKRGAKAHTGTPTVSTARPPRTRGPVVAPIPYEVPAEAEGGTQYPIADESIPEHWTQAAESVTPDPEPPDSVDDAWNAPKGEGVIFTVTKTVQLDVQGKLAFFLGMGASTWEMMDPICGKVAADRADLLAKKLTPLVCKSPGMVEFFTAKGGGYMEWIDAFIALWPILECVYAHHLSKSRGQMAPPVDATMPPDYSEYPA